MEFLSVEQALTLINTSLANNRRLGAAGRLWTKADILRALDYGQLVGVQTTDRFGKPKTAIVHPGIQFLEYIRNPFERLHHIPLLSSLDVAYILGISKKQITAYVSQGRLDSILVKPLGLTRSPTKMERRFTPEMVRRFIIKREKRDPRKSAEPTADFMFLWFWNLMQQGRANSYKVVDDELETIDRLPEPERSRKIEQLFGLIDEAKKKYQEATANEKTIRESQLVQIRKERASQADGV